MQGQKDKDMQGQKDKDMQGQKDKDMHGQKDSDTVCTRSHNVIKEFRCYEVKIEESKKASHRKSNPGPVLCH